MGGNERNQRLVRAVLDRHGTTYAEELKLDPAKPGGLFGLLVFAMLASSRIRATLAVSGAQALQRAGWTTAQKMAAASWAQRTRVLNESGYARYDERTSSMLGDAADFLLDSYDGDLRQLREAAGRDPARERELLQEIKGIGPVGADVFLREAQAVWGELVPYVDDRARQTAGELGLPKDPGQLLRLVAPGDRARLVAALVRSRLARDTAEIAKSVP